MKEPQLDPEVKARIDHEVKGSDGRFLPGKSGTAFVKAAKESKVATVRKLAWKLTPDALDTLHQIMMDGRVSPTARVKAAQEILNRAVGKPTQIIERTTDGRKLMEVSTQELVERISAFNALLSSGEAKPGDLPEPDILAPDGNISKDAGE